MTWFGLGKPRTKLGEWIDRNKVSQIKLAEESKVSRKTIERLCKPGDTEKPNRETALKIVKALRRLTNREVSVEELWG